MRLSSQGVVKCFIFFRRRDEGEKNNPSEAPSLERGAKEGIRLQTNFAYNTLRSWRRELHPPAHLSATDRKDQPDVHQVG